MGGDRGPSVSVPAALAAAREFRDVRFTLTGRQADLERELKGATLANVSCLFASDVVEMTDHPRDAFGAKKTHRCAAPSIWSRPTTLTPASVPATPARSWRPRTSS